MRPRNQEVIAQFVGIAAAGMSGSPDADRLYPVMSVRGAPIDIGTVRNQLKRFCRSGPFGPCLLMPGSKLLAYRSL